ARGAVDVAIDSAGVLCHGRKVGSDYPRRARDAACGLGDVVGQPLTVESGAGEQQLDVEERRPAAADAGEPVPVLELADHAPSASAIRRLCARMPRSLLQRARAASACRWASLIASSPALGSIVGCGGIKATRPRRSTPRQTRSAA